MDGDPYDLLGVTPKATDQEIKQAYYQKAKQLHPDINKRADPSLFEAVKDAYELLGNAERRKEYDLIARELGNSLTEEEPDIVVGSRPGGFTSVGTPPGPNWYSSAQPSWYTATGPFYNPSGYRSSNVYSPSGSVYYSTGGPWPSSGKAKP